MDAKRGARIMRDFVTNPTWDYQMGELREMLRKERAKMDGVASGDNISKVNTQMGMVKGVEHAIRTLENMKQDALESKDNVEQNRAAA